MEKYKETLYKVGFVYNRHVITIDLRNIIAIGHPREGDTFFNVYLARTTLHVPIDQHDKLFKAWMNINQ